MVYNLNDYVFVKLTQRGHEIHRKEHDDLVAEICSRKGWTEEELNMPYKPVDEDADGYSRWQLWTLMQTFGRHIAMGVPPPFTPNIILASNLQDAAETLAASIDKILKEPWVLTAADKQRWTKLLTDALEKFNKDWPRELR